MSKGTAKEIEICGHQVKLGDYLAVKYTTGRRFTGGIISGEVSELWNDAFPQARLSNGWCFHDHDNILIHTRNGETVK